jgi:alpha-tubulin suppressor-like RCC1 family protein
LNIHGQLGANIDITNAPMRLGLDMDWRVIAAGSLHSVAIKTDGSLWAWGFNGYGNVGNGTFEIVRTPTRIGTDSDWVSVSCGNRHTIARKADGRLFSWGDNEYGQIAQPATWLPHPVFGEADWGLP